jgi:hypothetical protein
MTYSKEGDKFVYSIMILIEEPTVASPVLAVLDDNLQAYFNVISYSF